MKDCKKHTDLVAFLYGELDTNEQEHQNFPQIALTRKEFLKPEHSDYRHTGQQKR